MLLQFQVVCLAHPTPLTPCFEWTSRHPEWIWCDDFEEDRLHSYFEYDRRNGQFMRTEGVGVGGSTGMRVTYVPRQAQNGRLHLAFGQTPAQSMTPVDEGIRNYREIFWRISLRHHPNWIGGGADKLTRAIVFTSASRSQAAIGHLWSGSLPGSDPNILYIDPASGTDEAGVVKSTVYNDFPNLRWLGAAGGRTPLFDKEHVGRWYCIEAHMRLNSPGQADGILEYWIDDELEARRDGLNWVGTYLTYGINAVFLENYANSGTPMTQERYWDDFIVATARIGCPDAPSNR